ncbi:MAG: hypothetical protein ACQES9_00645 [Myxococcota bacterium]
MATRINIYNFKSLLTDSIFLYFLSFIVFSSCSIYTKEKLEQNPFDYCSPTHGTIYKEYISTECSVVPGEKIEITSPDSSFYSYSIQILNDTGELITEVEPLSTSNTDKLSFYLPTLPLTSSSKITIRIYSRTQTLEIMSFKANYERLVLSLDSAGFATFFPIKNELDSTDIVSIDTLEKSNVNNPPSLLKISTDGRYAVAGNILNQWNNSSSLNPVFGTASTLYIINIPKRKLIATIVDTAGLDRCGFVSESDNPHNTGQLIVVAQSSHDNWKIYKYSFENHLEPQVESVTMLPQNHFSFPPLISTNDNLFATASLAGVESLFDGTDKSLIEINNSVQVVDLETGNLKEFTCIHPNPYFSDLIFPIYLNLAELENKKSLFIMCAQPYPEQEPVSEKDFSAVLNYSLINPNFTFTPLQTAGNEQIINTVPFAFKQQDFQEHSVLIPSLYTTTGTTPLNSFFLYYNHNNQNIDLVPFVFQGKAQLDNKLIGTPLDADIFLVYNSFLQDSNRTCSRFALSSGQEIENSGISANYLELYNDEQVYFSTNQGIYKSNISDYLSGNIGNKIIDFSSLFFKIQP